MYNHTELEESVRQYWQKINLAKKLQEHRKGKPKFFLLDGPPYVNAEAHVGHLKTRLCKDLFVKFKLMQGFNSWMQPGFDCHGLPIEVMVEKELGIKSKSEIEKMGVEKFDNLCLQKVANTEKKWINIYHLLGDWRAFYEPYFTYKDYYIESGWWTLKQLHKNGLLTQGKRPIHWCSHCETALSGYEVSDSYRNVTDPSIYIKFKVKGEKNTYLIAFTTTPWTLLGNVALAAHPDKEYVKVQVKKEIYILAENRLSPVAELAGFKYDIVEKFKGTKLEGLEYEPLLDVPQQKLLGKTARKVYMSIPIMKRKIYKKHRMKEENKTGRGSLSVPIEKEFDDFVTVDDGSGIVHSAPGHGSSDNFFGIHYKLDAVCPVDESGKFTEEAGQFKGIYVKDADKLIIEKLNKENKLLYHGKTTHSYPLCWRCKTPLIFRFTDQWYLTIDAIREKMLKENEKVRWLPEFGRERFEKWLEERTDWCISQQRYWGIPIPIWSCKSCGRFEIIESKAELIKKSVEKLDVLEDLHRHNVDKIRITCECGKEMARVKDIFNVWYDSGIAPWASLGYPYKNKELFENLFPMDMIVESQDQIRGWFDSLMFTSVGVFKKSSYKSVGLMGWVVDEKGEKMSKSIGNVIWAEDGLRELGADAIRLYYCLEAPPWELQKFSKTHCIEVRRHLNILLNIRDYYKTYLKPVKENSKNLEMEDLWILSRLNSTIAEVSGHIEKFEFNLVGKKLAGFFVNDLSRWYIKLIRKRNDGKAAYTLRRALEESIKLLAPVSPFITEHIYQDTFKKKDSIHMEDWPEVDKGALNDDLEKSMNLIGAIIETVNLIRMKEKIKLKYPLNSILISTNEKNVELISRMSNQLKRMANVKNIEFGGIDATYSVKLNFSSAGKKFGKDVKSLSKELEKMDAHKLLEELESGKARVGRFNIEREDVLFSVKSEDGISFGSGLLKLDTKITKELKEEWFVREFIRAVQEKRKELCLKASDNIIVSTEAALKKYKSQIERETGSTLKIGKIEGEIVEFEFENKICKLGIKR